MVENLPAVRLEGLRPFQPCNWTICRAAMVGNLAAVILAGRFETVPLALTPAKLQNLQAGQDVRRGAKVRIILRPGTQFGSDGVHFRVAPLIGEIFIGTKKTVKKLALPDAAVDSGTIQPLLAG